MLGASIIRHVRQAAARFIGADGGNVAVIFTIAAIPVIGFVGAAIDYTRMNEARSTMQSALDSTALMLSKDISSGKITASQVSATAQSYFQGLFNQPSATVLTFNATYNPDNGNLGSTVTLNGSGDVKTDFLSVLGFPTLGFTTSSTTAWGNVKMRVALALDNTGSMSQSGKITALRNAVAGSGGLIDQLSGLAKNPGDVLISVIPFAKDVNVGSSNYNQSWIDWTDWLNPPTAQPNNGSLQPSLPANWHGIGPGMNCPFSNGSGGFTCTKGPTSTSTTSTIPSSGTYSGYICPSVDANSHTKYNGCWDSELVNDATPQPFCAGSSCSCPSGAPTSGSKKCSCSGTGSAMTCTGPRYIHNWTQPQVTAAVGFNTQNTASQIPASPTANPNPEWTSTPCTSQGQLNCRTSVANNWTQTSTNPISTWTGCVTDRDQSYDAQGDAPASDNSMPVARPSTLFPANEYYENSESYCNQSNSPPLEQLTTLSYDWSTLKANVNAMQPTGGTNQAVGLAWAWQSLLTTGPIPAPAEDPNYTYNRVIIILSDGLNTEDRWPAYGDGSTQNNNSSGVGYIDARQTLLCQNLKSQIDPKTNGPMYTIYTIQVDTSSPPDPTSTILQNCASDPSKFFKLTSSSQIVTTFNTIGTALSELRVAR
ncbi:MAG TPA: TadE/TadG family type IV pilus assembly protein [Bradyrhizobium sp.]|nr:TadE/TadG family type IV pilus assembly protein [Bradyrhizobium sp.]